MSARLISRYADDPKVVAFSVVVLIAAALWLATWRVMGGMGGMAMDMPMPMPNMSDAMDGNGSMNMEMPATGDAMTGGTKLGNDGSMGSMSTKSMSSGTMASDGMSSGTMASGSMKSGEMAMQMDMPGMSMDPSDWSTAVVATTIAMWVLMMAAMMLPAMAPVTAIYAGLASKEDKGMRLAVRIGLFLSGYLSLWIGFSVFAAIGQLFLRGSDWFVMGGTLALPFAAGILLIVAGAYQFTPVKEFCLAHCRHPLTYLMSHWREGVKGAFPVGARHGLYCFGCCIALMGLMFVFGAMNVIWMAVIALYFLAEKILPRVEIWGRIAGALMIVAGAATLANELI